MRWAAAILFALALAGAAADLGLLRIVRDGRQFRCYSAPMGTNFVWFEWSHNLTNWAHADNETIYLVDGTHMTETYLDGYTAFYVRLRGKTN